MNVDPRKRVSRGGRSQASLDVRLIDPIATIRAHFKRRLLSIRTMSLIGLKDVRRGRESLKVSAEQRLITLAARGWYRAKIQLTYMRTVKAYRNGTSARSRRCVFICAYFIQTRRIIPRMKIHSPRELILSRPARPMHAFTFFFPSPPPCRVICLQRANTGRRGQSTRCVPSTFLDCDSAVICRQYPNDESAATRPPSFSINLRLISRIARCTGNSPR